MHRSHTRIRPAGACLVALVAAATASRAAAPVAPPAAIPADFTAFQTDVSPTILARRPVPAKHWRQIEPAVHQLALAHIATLVALDDDARAATLAALAGFIDTRRTAAATTPVLAPRRTVIGLLDPARGLDPQEITALAAAYDCDPVTVFKKDGADETLESVAGEFLAAVRAAAAAAPATVIVLGHGLPTEIQSYHIPFGRLADALLDGAAARAGPGNAIDLGGMVIVCDDCFSADFLVNLCTALEARCRDRGLPPGAPPTCIAGTGHGRVGHADVGAKFVPHFWRDVIELYFIRRPRPTAVTLGNFLENVDAMMYGYGRAPVMNGGNLAGWRLVDPELVQDPVVIVPLDAADLAELRRILGLPADALLPCWLEIG
ncbi:MAG: hypothetical protein ACKOSQ_04590 [Planctomycetaceae bacterium]